MTSPTDEQNEQNVLQNVEIVDLNRDVDDETFLSDFITLLGKMDFRDLFVVPQLQGKDTNSLNIESSNSLVTNDVAAVEIGVWFNGANWMVKASSKRHPTDRPDQNVAILLAYARALEKVASQFRRQASGLVKHNDDMRTQRKVAKKKVSKAAVKKARAAKKVTASGK